MKTSSKRRDYRKYKWKGKELAVNILLCAGVVLGLTYFFYRSVWAIIPLSAVGVWLFLRRMDGKIAEEKGQLSEQFKECILAVSSSLRAGYSVENAFVECLQDMEMMYGEEAEILKELKLIKGGLASHFSLEKLLHDMGRRTGLEEIKEFAEIFAITKRNGGSLAGVIQMTAGEISGKVLVEEEIRTTLASKRLEQKIMNGVPFLLVIYLEFTTPGYFEMFFRDFSGIALMTLFLIWYMAAYGLSEYILWKLENG